MVCELMELDSSCHFVYLRAWQCEEHFSLALVFLSTGKPLREWGAGLVALLPKVLQYVETEGRYVEENRQSW